LGYTRNVLLVLTDAKKYIYYSSFIDNEDDWSNEEFEKRLQSDGGLGARMTTAFHDTLETCTEVVIIGSDCPQLTSGHIQEAFQKLKTHDIVIGPSHDVGYYLLGMNKFYPALFKDIEWSTETVYQETLQKADAMHLKTFNLESLSDIDHEEDWLKYGF